ILNTHYPILLNEMPEISNEVKLYYEERLRSLGISDETNKITIPLLKAGTGLELEDTGETVDQKFFEPAEQGIQINYLKPNGQTISWKKDGTKWPRPYVRIRLHKEKTYEKEGK